MNLLVFFIPCFTILLTPSIKTPDLSNHFMILMISSISSFKVTKVVPYPALTTLHACIFFLDSPSISEADTMVTNDSSAFLFKKQEHSSIDQ